MADILELANVAGEGLTLDVPQRAVGQPLGLTAQFAGTLLQEMTGKQRDVLPTLPQRWQTQPDHVETVEQILAEQPLLDPFVEVLVGGRDDANAGTDRLVATDPVIMAIGQHAQQPGLQLGRHVANFVEEQGAALGLLEAPAALGGGAGEGAPLVAEQFRFEQIAGNRGGVDGDEGRVAARAVAMQSTGHEFLAAAGFAGDQHRRVGLGEPADRAKDLLHGRRLTEDLRRQQFLVLGAVLLRALLQRTAHEADRLIDVEGLRQVFEGAALKCCNRAVEIGVGGHDDDRQLRMALLDLVQQIEPRLARHPDVRHQRLRRFARALDRIEYLARTREAAMLDSLSGKRLLEHPADGTIVIDDPNGITHLSSFTRWRVDAGRRWPKVSGVCTTIVHQCSAAVTGSSTVKQVRPGRLATSIIP